MVRNRSCNSCKLKQSSFDLRNNIKLLALIFLFLQEITDVPPNPRESSEQTGWGKYISIKKD